MKSRNLGISFALIAMFLSFSQFAVAEDGATSSTVTRRTVVQSSSNTKTDTNGSTNSGNSGSSSSSSSTSETSEQSGVMGFQKSNKFAPKYKERIETYKSQIELGTTKGWLSADDAEKFKKELARLTELEAAVAAKNYVKPDIDDLDKQFTKFNMEFSNAGQKKPAAPAASGTAPSTTSSTAKSTPAPAAKAPAQKKPAPAAKGGASKAGKK